jgi:integrase
MSDVLTAALKTVKMKASTEEPAFRTPRCGPYCNFWTAFERAVQQAGLEEFTCHDLRHTFVSRLLMAGVALPTVKNLLEQSDEQVPAIFTPGQQPRRKYGS